MTDGEAARKRGLEGATRSSAVTNRRKRVERLRGELAEAERKLAAAEESLAAWRAEQESRQATA